MYSCVFILSYVSCKVHVSYCIVICGLSDPGMLFAHYFVNETVFGKKINVNVQCVF
jgi:hypothetical protein